MASPRDSALFPSILSAPKIPPSHWSISFLLARRATHLHGAQQACSTVFAVTTATTFAQVSMAKSLLLILSQIFLLCGPQWVNCKVHQSFTVAAHGLSLALGIALISLVSNSPSLTSGVVNLLVSMCLLVSPSQWSHGHVYLLLTLRNYHYVSHLICCNELNSNEYYYMSSRPTDQYPTMWWVPKLKKQYFAALLNSILFSYNGFLPDIDVLSLSSSPSYSVSQVSIIHSNPLHCHTFRAQVPMIHQSCYRSYWYSHHWICKISAVLPISLDIFKTFALVKVYVSLWPTGRCMILHPNCLFRYSSLVCAHVACIQNNFLAMYPKY